MSLRCTLTLEDPEYPSVSRGDFRIERSWGMLNFILSRSGGSASSDVAEFLISDWEELAPEAHRIPPAEVAKIASWLATMDNEEIIQEYNPAVMAGDGVYDADLALANPDDYLNKLAGLLVGLRAFMAQANAVGAPIIRVIC